MVLGLGGVGRGEGLGEFLPSEVDGNASFLLIEKKSKLATATGELCRGGTRGVFLSPAVPGDADLVASGSHAGLSPARSGCGLTALLGGGDQLGSSSGSSGRPRGPDSGPGPGPRVWPPHARCLLHLLRNVTTAGHSSACRRGAQSHCVPQQAGSHAVGQGQARGVGECQGSAPPAGDPGHVPHPSPTSPRPRPPCVPDLPASPTSVRPRPLCVLRASLVGPWGRGAGEEEIRGLPARAARPERRCPAGRPGGRGADHSEATAGPLQFLQAAADGSRFCLNCRKRLLYLQLVSLRLGLQPVSCRPESSVSPAPF